MGMPAFVSTSVGRPSRHAGVGFCSVLLTVKTVDVYLIGSSCFFFSTLLLRIGAKRTLDTLGGIILHTFFVSWGAPYIPFLCCFAS